MDVGSIIEVATKKVIGYLVGLKGGRQKAFMVEVLDRSAATLLPLIQQHILPGTTVLSDEWRSYSRIPTLGMVHETVNGTSAELFPTCLQEFLWRKRFKDEDHFSTIIQHITEQYPL